MFCARGHRRHLEAEYFRLEGDGLLSMRLVSEEEGAEHDMARVGHAERAEFGQPAANIRNVLLQDIMGDVTDRLEQGDTAGGLHRQAGELNGLVAAMGRGLQRMANNEGAGLSEQQRQAFHRQAAGIERMLGRMANQNALLQHFGDMGFVFDPDFVAGSNQGNGGGPQQEHPGVPEAAARSFCEEHGIPQLPDGVERGDEGWMCPICYLGEDDGPLTLLCEGDGKLGRNSHVFHQ